MTEYPDEAPSAYEILRYSADGFKHSGFDQCPECDRKFRPNDVLVLLVWEPCGFRGRLAMMFHLLCVPFYVANDLAEAADRPSKDERREVDTSVIEETRNALIPVLFRALRKDKTSVQACDSIIQAIASGKIPHVSFDWGK